MAIQDKWRLLGSTLLAVVALLVWTSPFWMSLSLSTCEEHSMIERDLPDDPNAKSDLPVEVRGAGGEVVLSPNAARKFRAMIVRPEYRSKLPIPAVHDFTFRCGSDYHIVFPHGTILCRTSRGTDVYESPAAKAMAAHVESKAGQKEADEDYRVYHERRFAAMIEYLEKAD